MTEKTQPEWKDAARLVLVSHFMTDERWGIVLDALLEKSEGDGLGSFDVAVDRMLELIKSWYG